MEYMTEVIIGAGGLILANFAAKLGRAYPLLSQMAKYLKAEAVARKDKNLTQKEKAELYDEIDRLYKEAWSIIKGYFPNKS